MPEYRHALVVGKFAPFHKGHQLTITRALDLADRVTIFTWSNPPLGVLGYPPMNSIQRCRWIRNVMTEAGFGARIDVHGFDFDRNCPPDAAPDYVHRSYVGGQLLHMHLHPDVIVSSEDYGPGFAEALGITHEFADIGRKRIPISGTQLRADVHTNRHFLDPVVYRDFVQRIVVLGAESTGKTTLATALARDLNTVLIPELGREVWERLGGKLELQDYADIARRQRNREDVCVPQTNHWQVCDTNALTTMWFSHYYNRDSVAELQRLANQCKFRYEHTFVCDDDIPFEQDGWRDTEEWRTRAQGMVLHDLRSREIPFVVVHGTIEDRLEQIHAVIDTPQ